MVEWVVYSRESGFNIVEAIDEQSAEMLSGMTEAVCLDSIEEIDKEIVKRIRELLK